MLGRLKGPTTSEKPLPFHRPKRARNPLLDAQFCMTSTENQLSHTQESTGSSNRLFLPGNWLRGQNASSNGFRTVNAYLISRWKEGPINKPQRQRSET
ncbi:hypothetical protein MPNT_230016 [Candidatus Methylacidithermus pantelleriae]|uniref:Uncharacterized protein n=1 Tax=Candidatus Methylacidithermus pantelleriae TaxID=2744239 RepID=A0A8J2BLY1_9BACT|nr:hypothetical protein MPNT_230016 [Candidatus Methylacidithermus pantelleriae]